MLTDVFKSCGYDATTLNCRVDPNTIKLDLSDIPIERELSPNNYNKFYEIVESIISIVSYATGNHAITAVKYEGEIYCFDPTNLCYLGKINNNQVEILNGEGTFDIKYLSTALFNDMNLMALTGENADYEEQIENSKYLDERILQEFYEKEKEIYQKIKDGCQYKIPLIFVCLASALLAEIRSVITNKIKKAIEHKRRAAFNKEIEKDIEEIRLAIQKIKFD